MICSTPSIWPASAPSRPACRARAIPRSSSCAARPRSRRRRSGSARCAAWSSAGASAIAPWPRSPSSRRHGPCPPSSPPPSGYPAVPRYLVVPVAICCVLAGIGFVAVVRLASRPRGRAVLAAALRRRERPVRRLPRRRAAPSGGRCEGARRYALGALAGRRPGPARELPVAPPAPDRRAGRAGERPGLEARPPPGRRRPVVLTGSGHRLHRGRRRRRHRAAAAPRRHRHATHRRGPWRVLLVRWGPTARSGFDGQRARRAHSMQSTLSGAAARRAGAIGSPQPSQMP